MFTFIGTLFQLVVMGRLLHQVQNLLGKGLVGNGPGYAGEKISTRQIYAIVLMFANLRIENRPLCDQVWGWFERVRSGAALYR